MIDFRKLSPTELRKVQMFVCSLADETPVTPGLTLAECDAGCGDSISYPTDAPDFIPKVCADCADWLTHCQGNA